MRDFAAASFLCDARIFRYEVVEIEEGQNWKMADLGAAREARRAQSSDNRLYSTSAVQQHE